MTIFKKMMTAAVGASLAVSLSVSPAMAFSSFGGSSLPIPPSHAGPKYPAQPSRADVAKDLYNRIVAANQNLGHMHSPDMDAHAARFAGYAKTHNLNWVGLTNGIDYATYDDNYGTIRGALLRVKDHAVPTYIRSLYTLPSLKNTGLRVPFGVAVDPDTGDYFIAISAHFG